MCKFCRKVGTKTIFYPDWDTPPVRIEALPVSPELEELVRIMEEVNRIAERMRQRNAEAINQALAQE